jgi:uncharacterized coiled-coil DUF342 family protein
MTAKEQAAIEGVRQITRELVDNNRKFQEAAEARIQKIEKIVETKHLPVNLEQEILGVAQKSIGEAIKSVLCGYNSPLGKLVEQVVNENTPF